MLARDLTHETAQMLVASLPDEARYAMACPLDDLLCALDYGEPIDARIMDELRLAYSALELGR